MVATLFYIHIHPRIRGMKQHNPAFKIEEKSDDENK